MAKIKINRISKLPQKNELAQFSFLSFLCPRKERTKESALKLFLLLRRKSFRIKKKKLYVSPPARRFWQDGEASYAEASADLSRLALGRCGGFGKTVRPLTPRLRQTFTA
ncbi:MAG: hypothetical protein E7618_08150 [Ruminococcaceae bacterium]|nr:hypothetical protein [Oscillospiraceae bacterium]